MKRSAGQLIAALARTRAGRLAMWKALPACGVERLAVRTPDGKFMVSARDNMIAHMLFVDGSFDKHLVEMSCSLATEYLGRSDLSYLDIGANLGTNTIYALRQPGFTHAICFEPNAENFSNLVETIRINRLTHRVRCQSTALGDMDGTAILELSTINFGDHRVVAEAEAGVPGEAIRITTLDASLSASEVDSVGLVSIDVQGFEAQVLAGASKLLERDIPFICELTPGHLRQCGGYDRFFEIAVRSFGWFVDMKTPGRLRPIGELRGCADALIAGAHTDVFLTKRPW